MKTSSVRITKQWLEERCTKDGQHLLWTMAVGNGGPRGHFRHPDGRQGQFSVRHAAWALWQGEQLAEGMTARPRCGDHRCLSKQCLEQVVHGGYNKGKPRTIATRKKMADRARERVGHPPEVVATIRAGEKPALELAADLGISRKSVDDIQRGRRWVDFGNPYMQLGARNA